MQPQKNFKLTTFLFLSNAVTIILLTFLLIKEEYPKRIGGKLRSSFSKKNVVKVANSDLKKMNQVFMPLFVDTASGHKGEEFKILIIGNSLTRHGIAREIGWTHISGMAATSENEDYVHLIFNHLQNKLPTKKVAMRLSNFAEFERFPKSLNISSLDTLISFKPNLIIYQLGENVSLNDTMTFKEKYMALINYTKEKTKAITICTTPFFPSSEKNDIINQVAKKTNSYLVDLSHLPLLNEQDYAKNEKAYQGDKTIWKSEGIGIHPGDKGMRDIAEQILITINAVLSESRK